MVTIQINISIVVGFLAIGYAPIVGVAQEFISLTELGILDSLVHETSGLITHFDRDNGDLEVWTHNDADNTDSV